MSTPASKWNKGGWKKYEFPPDMITEEENSDKIKLTWDQIKRQMDKQIENRILASEQRGDYITSKEWKAARVRIEAKSIGQRINEEFVQDFIKWLTGRSIYNSEKFFELVHDGDGQVVSKDITPGCPWGNTPLTNLPGVSEFLDQGIDRRSRVITYIAKLKLRGPRNLNEAYMYYKYILRKTAVDEDTCYEVESMADFDYPVDPDTGETVGPGDTDVPPLFDEKKYAANFLCVYALFAEYPAVAAEWMYEGAPPLSWKGKNLDFDLKLDDINSFLYTTDYDVFTRTRPNGQWYTGYRGELGWQVYEEALAEGASTEEAIAERDLADAEMEREARRRDRRRKLRKKGRMPSAKAARGAPSFGLGDITITPLETHRTERRMERRDERRDGRVDQKREDLFGAQQHEGFGTSAYVSFWALSPTDQDYMLSMLLANSAFNFANQAQSSGVLTGESGGPVVTPQSGRNEAQYPYPGEESDYVKNRDKLQTKLLAGIYSKIADLPGALKDPAVNQVLEDISNTTKNINEKLDNPPPIPIINQAPVSIDTDSIEKLISAQTTIMGDLKNVMGNLTMKIDTMNANFGNGPLPPALQESIKNADDKLEQVVAVLRGMPKEFADLIPRNQQPPPPESGAAAAVTNNTITGNTTIDVGESPAINVNSATIQNKYKVGNISVPLVDADTLGQKIGQAINVPRPDVKVDMGQGLGEEIGKSIKVPTPKIKLNEVDLGRAIGQAIPATKVEVDMSGFSKTFEQFLDVQDKRATAQNESMTVMQQQISDLYETMKALQTGESTRLDAVKQVLEQLTPVQLQVAEILSLDKKAASYIEESVKLQNKPIEEKITQIVSLDDASVNKLLSGSLQGVNDLQGSISNLSKSLEESLYTQDDQGRRVGLANVMGALARHSALMQDHTNRLLTEYLPQTMEKHLPENLMHQFLQKLNDPESVFNNRIAVADVNNENFPVMENKIKQLEFQLEQSRSGYEQKLLQADQNRQLFEEKVKNVMMEAALKNNQEKQMLEAQLIEMRNNLAREQGLISANASEYALLSSSHAALKDELIRFKSRNEAFAEMTNLLQEKVVPEIRAARQEIVSAVENSSLGVGEEESERVQQAPPLAIEDKEAAHLVSEARERTLLEAGIQPTAPETFISKEMAESKKTLETLVDEQLQADPTTSIFNVIVNPILALSKKLEGDYGSIPQTMHGGEMTEEQRSGENQKLMTDAYLYSMASQFEEFPLELKQLLNTPLAGITQDPTERIKHVVRALTLLTKANPSKHDNAAVQSRAAYDSVMDLLTNYTERVSQMKDSPETGGKSVLAERMIGKVSGIHLRDNTHYQIADNVSSHPTTVHELDGYAALTKVGRKMEAAYQKGDSTTFTALKSAVQKFGGFSGNGFVADSPLYKAMVAGDEQSITNALAQEGTAHLNENYYTPAIRTRIGMAYDSFKTGLLDNAQGEIEEVVADEAYDALGPSGFDTGSILADKQLAPDAALPSYEAGVYLESLALATMAFTQRLPGSDPKELMRDPVQFQNDNTQASGLYQRLKNENNAFLQANIHLPEIRKALKSRTDTVNRLAEKYLYSMYGSLDANYVSQVKNNRAQLAINGSASSLVEATDTINGLSSSSALSVFNSPQYASGRTLVDHPRTRVVASQLKHAVSALENEASTHFSQQKQTMLNTPSFAAVIQSQLQAIQQESVAELDRIWKINQSQRAITA